MGKLRLIREYRGNSLSEFIAYHSLVSLVRGLYKLIYRLFFQRIHIRLSVEAVVIRIVFQIGKILFALGTLGYIYASV